MVSVHSDLEPHGMDKCHMFFERVYLIPNEKNTIGEGNGDMESLYFRDLSPAQLMRSIGLWAGHRPGPRPIPKVMDPMNFPTYSSLKEFLWSFHRLCQSFSHYATSVTNIDCTHNLFPCRDIPKTKTKESPFTVS